MLIQESFTAFGERRGANWTGSPSAGDWTQIASTTRRGFTAHEHLDNLDLIHMNGRVYDPGLGRFLSADPFIDGWRTTQGYNRYSYVANNPLRAIDPSGFSRLSPDIKEENEHGSGGNLPGRIVEWSPEGVTVVPVWPRSTPGLLPDNLASTLHSSGTTSQGGGSVTVRDPWVSAAATLFRMGVYDYQDPFMGSYLAEAVFLLPVAKPFKFVFVLSIVKGTRGGAGAARGTTRARSALQTPERIVVDSRGNAIPLNRGEYLTRSPDGRWVQVRDASGNPTGMRIDGPHNPRTHSDPRALQPHAHVPGVRNPDGTPWLPIK